MIKGRLRNDTTGCVIVVLGRYGSAEHGYSYLVEWPGGKEQFVCDLQAWLDDGGWVCLDTDQPWEELSKVPSPSSTPTAPASRAEADEMEKEILRAARALPRPSEAA